MSDERDKLLEALDTLYFELKAGTRDSALYAMRHLHADVIADLERRRDERDRTNA